MTPIWMIVIKILHILNYNLVTIAPWPPAPLPSIRVNIGNSAPVKKTIYTKVAFHWHELGV